MGKEGRRRRGEARGPPPGGGSAPVAGGGCALGEYAGDGGLDGVRSKHVADLDEEGLEGADVVGGEALLPEATAELDDAEHAIGVRRSGYGERQGGVLAPAASGATGGQEVCGGAAPLQRGHGLQLGAGADDGVGAGSSPVARRQRGAQHVALRGWRAGTRFPRRGARLGGVEGQRRRGAVRGQGLGKPAPASSTGGGAPVAGWGVGAVSRRRPRTGARLRPCGAAGGAVRGAGLRGAVGSAGDGAAICRSGGDLWARCAVDGVVVGLPRFLLAEGGEGGGERVVALRQGVGADVGEVDRLARPRRVAGEAVAEGEPLPDDVPRPTGHPHLLLGLVHEVEHADAGGDEAVHGAQHLAVEPFHVVLGRHRCGGGGCS